MIRKGDRLRLRPEWCDHPDEQLVTYIVCEDEDGGRCLIMADFPAMPIKPCERVTTNMVVPQD